MSTLHEASEEDKDISRAHATANRLSNHRMPPSKPTILTYERVSLQSSPHTHARLNLGSSKAVVDTTSLSA